MSASLKNTCVVLHKKREEYPQCDIVLVSSLLKLAMFCFKSKKISILNLYL